MPILFLARLASSRALCNLIALPILILALAGCAGLNHDAGFSEVTHLAKTRSTSVSQLSWQRTQSERDAAALQVTTLLSKTLDVDDAVQIALLNNKELQVQFDQLGIADANYVQAGRLANPGFTFGRLNQAGSMEIDRGLSFNLMQLLTMPMARRIEQYRMEQTKLEVVKKILTLIYQTRQRYYSAVAAQQLAQFAGQINQLAQSGAELAHRMQQAGNFNYLQQAREQSFYADAAVFNSRAEQEQQRATEQLIRVLGLDSSISLKLPSRLPDLPDSIDAPTDLEQLAMSERLDVKVARLQLSQLSENLGLMQATRFINVLDVGYQNNTYTNEPNQQGYQVRLELPLFDSGDANSAKAETMYRQGLNNTAQIAINARSEVRLAYGAYRSGFAIATQFRHEIVPLQKKISEQNQLRYNAMLIDVFELLADARAQMRSVSNAIEAERDFWLAQADMQMSLVALPVH